jgi:hypothetical protein
MAFQIGSFMDGLFAGAKSTNELIESRNKLEQQGLQLESARDIMRRAEEGTPEPDLTRTPGEKPPGYGEPTTGSTTPAEALPPESVGATRFGGGEQGSRRRSEPTPEQTALIEKAAAEYKIDPRLLHGLLSVESDFNPTIVSPAGAQGIAQLMPKTAKDLGVTDPFDINQAIPAAAKYLRQGLDAHGGDLNKALMYYHGGPDQSIWGPKTQAYPGAVIGRATSQFSYGSPVVSALGTPAPAPVPTPVPPVASSVTAPPPTGIAGVQSSALAPVPQVTPPARVGPNAPVSQATQDIIRDRNDVPAPPAPPSSSGTIGVAGQDGRFYALTPEQADAYYKEPNFRKQQEMLKTFPLRTSALFDNTTLYG